MAIALQDAGFEDVEVDFHGFSLDGSEYLLDDELVKWQQDAIVGWGMMPIRMRVVPKATQGRVCEGFMTQQLDGNAHLAVEVTANHIYGASPDNTFE